VGRIQSDPPHVGVGAPVEGVEESPTVANTVVRQGSGRPAIAVRPGGRRVVERGPTGGPAASWSVARAGWAWCPPRPAGGIPWR